MTRDEAVTRLQEGLGFANRQTTLLQSRLREAQRDLEMGKTLPKFLLQEGQTLILAAATSTVALPAGFLRMDDDNPPHYLVDSASPTFVAIKRNYREALEANYSTDAGGPKVGVILQSTIDFITTADIAYTLTWSYYKADALLTSNIENEWLAHASDWLIGEAGSRIARSIRDKDAMAEFDWLTQRGRAAVFGEIIASEEASGPLVMGGNL